MRHRSIFWPLTLIAIGFLWILVNMNVVPAVNLWALAYLLPYVLMALGIGLILRSQWRVAGMVVSALVVVGAVAAVIYAPQLGWAKVPPWGFESGIGGRVTGSGKIEAQTREVSGFTSVSVNYPAAVVIRQGGSESVKVEADDNLLSQLSTKVRNDTLYIQNDEGDWTKRVNPTQTVKITITVKDLHDVDFSTAGTVRIENLNTDDLQVTLSGAGEATLIGFKAHQLDCSLSGAGNIHVDGSADNVKVRIDGFGSFYGDKLNSVEADVSINGAGNVNLRVKDQLTAEINGAGSVGYYGTPDVNQQVNGAGAVNQLGK